LAAALEIRRENLCAAGLFTFLPAKEKTTSFSFSEQPSFSWLRVSFLLPWVCFYFLKIADFFSTLC